MFRFGSHEIIIGSNIAKRYQGTGIGEQVRFGDAMWTVVGHFDAEGSGFESEIWGDVEQLMPAFGRPVFSSVTLKLKNAGEYETVKKEIEGDPRTQYAELKREKTYYADQSKMMSDFIKILGLIVTIIFSIGAMIGAMITMYAAVANRQREIGTLRALGFSRTSILGSFLLESVLLATIGGAVGIAASFGMGLVRFSMVNFASWSEVVFSFELTPRVVVTSLAFACGMGLLGGLFPAVRAARISALNAIRA
jgi:ABC-type lipoprotein release transport system permease subunit